MLQILYVTSVYLFAEQNCGYSLKVEMKMIAIHVQQKFDSPEFWVFNTFWKLNSL